MVRGFFLPGLPHNRDAATFPTRRSSDLALREAAELEERERRWLLGVPQRLGRGDRSEEHTSELQSRVDLVCRLLLEKKKPKKKMTNLTSITIAKDRKRHEQTAVHQIELR